MRSSISNITFSLAVGLAVGTSGPLLQSMGDPVSHVASIALVAGWMYALIAFGVGWAARSKRGAALTALATLVVAVVAYYGTKAAQGGFRAPDFDDPANADGFFAWNEFLSVIVVWCVFAVLLGPLCGLAGHLSRTGSRTLRPLLRLPCRLLVPAVVVFETSLRLIHEPDGQDGAVVRPVWIVTRLLAVAVALVLVATAVVATRRDRDGGAERGGTDVGSGPR
ncbi:DUF6518 family protein [Streptomyces sp. NPDC059443]|uniref:DUF6518 family protein n=1 Tax=unclassified Streptomyces TaxID=2593676 RepID=UPI0036A8DB5E